MDRSRAEPSDMAEPLVVRSHVMPWGFVIALPLALAFAYVGAWGLDLGLAPEAIVEEQAPLWIFSLPLLAFSLFLFLIGVGELATYLKPAVAIVVDASGVTTHGMLGARRMAWDDVVDSRIEGGAAYTQRSCQTEQGDTRAPSQFQPSRDRAGPPHPADRSAPSRPGTAPATPLEHSGKARRHCVTHTDPAPHLRARRGEMP